MNFTSLAFVVFFIVFFVLYWLVNKQLRLQNILILIGSYVFYGWWDYRFLLLMFLSSLLDFYIGIKIYESQNSRLRQFLMGLSLFVNLGLLLYFKYLNFFIDSFTDMLWAMGMHVDKVVLDIILPVGVSFYTFQILSYSLDIYKGKFKPTYNLIDFLGFVAFFPQLVAGPIERASVLLPQFYIHRKFDYEKIVDGARLILYGFFKKLVIADNIALRVQPMFSNPAAYSGVELFIGSMFFITQLYTDLSGYSDIARGTARLLGFELMINFKTPFFATSVPESWRRWHISLTTWFRDYYFLWIVKYNINSLAWRILCTTILFVTIGLWHGANLKYVTFGFIISLFFIPTLVAKNSKGLKNAIKECNTNPYIIPFAMFVTFSSFALTAIFFRAENIAGAIKYYESMINNPFLGVSIFNLRMLIVCIIFYIYEWFMKEEIHQFDIKKFPGVVRKIVYVFIIACILLFGHFADDPFYYFQF